jgi:predicted nucleic acid-binding protein
LIILDTNVVSETSKPFPNAEAVAWLNRQAEETLFLTAINVAELQEGIVTLPDGKRKEFCGRQSMMPLTHS